MVIMYIFSISIVQMFQNWIDDHFEVLSRIWLTIAAAWIISYIAGHYLSKILSK